MDTMNRDRRIAGIGTSAAAWRDDPALARVPTLQPAQLLRPGARIVVVAPHPDDEILACGGLLHLMKEQGPAPLLIAVTDGEGSHPDSPAWPRERLLATRPQETLAALACLGATSAEVLRLGLPDGGVAAREAALGARLASIFQPGDVVITTWRYDGHPDHEASARACVAAARARGAQLLEVPVWGWHWSAPGDGAMPLAAATKLALSPEVVERKRAAMACFHSQLSMDASTGAGPILPGFALERALNPFELYFHDTSRP